MGAVAHWLAGIERSGRKRHARLANTYNTFFVLQQNLGDHVVLNIHMEALYKVFESL